MALPIARNRHQLAAIAAMLAAALLTVVDCDSGTAPNPSARISMSATIDGAAWIAATPKHGTPPYASYYPWDSTLVISGIRSYGTDSALGIVVILGPVTGPGSFPLGPHSSRSYGTLFRATGDVYAGTYRTRWWYTDDSTSGSATVTTFDPATRHLDGSFSFIARDSTGLTRQVAQGLFSGTWIASPLD
jgi:hypothetical protein